MNYGALADLLLRHEGVRFRKYLCSRGFATIGCGWNLDARKLPRDIEAYYNLYGEITEPMVTRLLNISITTAEKDCKDIFPDFDQFTERRQMALIDMVFNMGAGGVCGFKKMRRAIAAGDWNEAANQVNDSAYWRQLGGDPAGQDDGKLERPEEIAMMLREG